MYKEVLVFALCLYLTVTITEAQLSFKAGYCPLRNSVKQCTPRCVSDHQCLLREKCCPNNCGSTSCTAPSAFNTGSDGGYKGSAKSGSSVTCAGIQCRSHEKCQFDKATKRDKCTRA